METCAECGKPINPGEPAYAVSDPWGKTQLQKVYHSKCGDPLGIKAKDAEIERLRAENDMMRSLIIDAPTKEERDAIFDRRFASVKNAGDSNG